MTASTDWSVVESDEEWQQYNPTETVADPKTGSIVDVAHVPVKLAAMFTEIKEKKVLPINCTCPRSGGLTRTISPIQQQSSVNKELDCAEEIAEADQKNLVDTR